MNTVNVSQAVLDGIMAVRDSGITNMLDRPAVVRMAIEMGHAETATWIEAHTSEYATGIIYGFNIQEDT